MPKANKSAPVVKRLAPKKETLRELYLKSGNRCAFPGCSEIMIDAEGYFVGQLCHIEAADEGGERFNPSMTNEDRRKFENLMLMCYPHHVKTNDVTAYPVAVLQKMKAVHEAKFTDVASAIENAITDKSASVKPKPASTLAEMNAVLGWGHDKDELRESLKDVTWAAERLKCLPRRTRQFLTVVISRLKRVDLPKASGQKYRFEEKLLAGEVEEACEIGPPEVKKQMQLLEKYDIGELDHYDDYAPAAVRLKATPEDWFIWGDLREYCSLKNVPLAALIEELRFDLLD